MGVSPISCDDPRNRFAPSWSKGRAVSLVRDPEFRRYLSMAMGSADEARLWCDYAADLDYVPRETALALAG